jgi:hypothetical protein
MFTQTFACHFNSELLTMTLSAPQESMDDELLRKGLPQVSSIPFIMHHSTLPHEISDLVNTTVNTPDD